MRTLSVVVTVLVMGLAGPALSQDSAPPPLEDETARPVRSIRVLQSPYDLASFYSARPGQSSVTPPVPHDPAYALASFYRSRQSGPPPGMPPGPWLWAPFWARGYGARGPSAFIGYRHSIGENGDLFLVVPFLAPLGPLNGAFPGF